MVSEPNERLDSNNPSPFAVGQVVSDRYEVESLIGSGGMGLVYRVKQIYLNSEFALKTINKENTSEKAVMRFQQEARTAFSLNHPSIISVNDFGVLRDGTPYLVMDLLNGETLGERLKRLGSLKLEEALPVFVQTCFGLAYAHDAGIIHRDIKPGNIMLLRDVEPGSDGSVKIVDFGIAKLTAHEDGEIQALTRTGEIFGSPLYMSPEQGSGIRVDHRSDIYALGCVFFEALTGTPPFVGDTALSTLMKHQSEQAPTLKEASLGVDFPIWIEQIIARMLAKSPDQRYDSLGAVAIDLGARGDAVRSKSGGKRSDKASARIEMSREKFIGLAVLIVACSVCLTASLCFWFFSKKNTTTTALATPPVSIQSARSDVPQFNENKHVQNSDDLLSSALKKVAGTHGQLQVKFEEVTPESLDRISKAPRITDIDFESAVLPNESLDKLAKLRLTNVFLADSNFDDDGAAALSKCKTLKSINADNTFISNAGVRSLTSIDSLNKLEISGSYINDDTLAALTKAKSLEILALRNSSPLSREGFKNLASLKNFHWLSLTDDLVKRGDYAAIANIRTLRYLVLHQSITVSELFELCEKLKSGCKEFSGIELKDCPTIKPKDVDILQHRFPQFLFKVTLPPPANF